MRIPLIDLVAAVLPNFHRDADPELVATSVRALLRPHWSECPPLGALCVGDEWVVASCDGVPLAELLEGRAIEARSVGGRPRYVAVGFDGEGDR